jgi:D-alanyl-D-alanine carboxypeptidase
VVLKPKIDSVLRTVIVATMAGCFLFPSVTSLPQALAETPSPSPTSTAVQPSPSVSANNSQPSPTTSDSVPAPVFTALPSVDAPDSIWVVVDKQRPLKPANWVPKNLVTPKFTDGAGVNPRGIQMAKPAGKAIKLMATAMKAAGAGTLALASTYRSYSSQVAVHAKDVAALGLVAGEKLAARPGYSEHQTGLAADVSALNQGCVIQVCFAKTRAGKWLAANSWQFGFILRYPDGRTATTGYQFEPWHFRYVGLDLSTRMHRDGLTVLEDALGLPAAPNY